MTTATSACNIGARIANRLNEKLGPKRYAMWFDRSARFEFDDHSQALRVTVANKFLADGIGRQFRQQVCQAAREELGHDVDLDLGVRPPTEGQQRTAPPVTPVQVPRSPRRPGAAPRVAASGSRWRYSLDDFVVGPSNQLAFAAASKLADSDDATGPLFIYGGCGLGKTHLLQGLCQRLSRRRPDAKVHYTTGEQFTNDYITAVRTNAIDAFRKKVRRLDLLAVDDVHFIANKEKTQQEFLHCFKDIEMSGARVVLVSDCHPHEINRFSEALTSRCVRGIVARIDAPDTDTRLRLVEALAERRGLALAESVAQVIAERTVGSVRDVEGALNKLQALSMLHRNARPNALAVAPVIGRGLVEQLFQDQPDPAPRKPVRYQAILDAVCERFALTAEQVTGRMRKAHLVLARSLLIHLTYDLTGMSYPEIAAAMGRPNHSTIITAAGRIRKQLEQDKPILLPGQADELTPSRLLEQLRQTICG